MLTSLLHTSLLPVWQKDIARMASYPPSQVQHCLRALLFPQQYHPLYFHWLFCLSRFFSQGPWSGILPYHLPPVLSFSLQTSFFRHQSTLTLSTCPCCSLRLQPSATCLLHYCSFTLPLPRVSMAHHLAVRPYFTLHHSVVFNTTDSCLLPETSSSVSFQNRISSIFWAILMESLFSNHTLVQCPWKQTGGWRVTCRRFVGEGPWEIHL